ncbi:MAG: DEAD/DEAH box helicase family protein [Gemmatimonadaceae bacterium]|nr:DEAD/DEAH box helicase family protein [Gemmatimonadaceae bacterium]
MALHPDFPTSPYAPLVPAHRWFPADESLRATAYGKLLPPLVAKIRLEVAAWRKAGYAGAADTSVALLTHWFTHDHLVERADRTLESFRYYTAQREAVETVIWLHDVKRVRDKHDLFRFDSSGAVSGSMFAEDWPRFVLKMATGAGKTKVLSLLMAWSFFHRTYEVDSELSRNFLLIAPNIIVLDRLRADFDGLRIFFTDPVLPPNGYAGRNWRDDFQVTLHLQDDVRVMRETGNIFLTNIHRVFLHDVPEPSLDDPDLTDYFLSPFGPTPTGRTNDSKTDLGEIVREIEELAVFNDEAHHIHDARMAWFKSIQNIHGRMLQKDRRLSIQIDVTATPRHDNGAIFVQTVSDYPLVEAIHQNVVKHPVLPDAVSRGKLRERTSSLFPERYADYLALGVEEWRKSYDDHKAMGKKAVLFVMVDDTRNCDDVGEYLEKTCPELQGAVLVIHTRNNGEISEAASGKSKEELELLRKQSNLIDTWASPYKAIVSVLMLKEGWDVRNVTTIVGLRAYSSTSNILPEQTLGRGLRRMYFGSDVKETVSVMGTAAFMDFVESIQVEGVTFDQVPMGPGTTRKDSLVVEVDRSNEDKDLEALDIALPKLARRFQREFTNLDRLDASTFGSPRLPLKPFSDDESREIVFKQMLDAEVHHTILLDGAGVADWRSVVGFFARQILQDLRLVGGYDAVYGQVKRYIREYLFAGPPVDLESPEALRNLSEPEVGKLLYDTFKAQINALTVKDSGETRIEGEIRLSDTRPFRTDYRENLPASKSIFSTVVAEPNRGGFEMTFAAFLQDATDVQSFTKNYLAIGFRMDYVKRDGDLSNYIPDFIVRTTSGTVWIIETKGRAELDLPQKMQRLKQWCEDATAASVETTGTVYRFAYVDQESFERFRPATMAALASSFTEYQS